VAWDGVVYAVSEGLLLSTLPALMAWQILHALAWAGPAGAVSRVVFPLFAARGLTYRDVTFAASDGVRLSAWYVPSTNHAAVVAVPGSGSTRTGTLDQAAVLAGHGYGVLMADPRGQGRSGGRAMDAGWYGDRDIGAAVTFLQHQPGVDPNRVGVLGLSMGGEEAIGATANPAIRAVVAEGATHRTAADKAGYLPGGITGAMQRGMDRLTYAAAALVSSRPNQTRCTRPSPWRCRHRSCSSPAATPSTSPRPWPTYAPPHRTASRPGRSRTPRTPAHSLRPRRSGRLASPRSWTGRSESPAADSSRAIGAASW
jgi:dienelactone hydrolase